LAVIGLYQLLPLSLVGLVAATLSWIEIVSGISLFLGCLLRGRRFSNPFPVGAVLRRSGLLLILGQSLLFAAVLLITLARGLKIDCGCGLFFQRQVGLASILEDALLLGVAGWLYWRECQAGDREEGSLILVQPKL
jgi:putative oxidoreductase